MAKPEFRTQGSRRLGRPPGAPESLRHKRVVTLMTNAEFEKLTKIADKEEKSVSALVHQIISRYLKRRS
jgi:hypothetical protein